MTYSESAFLEVLFATFNGVGGCDVVGLAQHFEEGSPSDEVFWDGPVAEVVGLVGLE